MRGARVCGGPCRGLEWPGWAQKRVSWVLVGPWQYQCSRGAGVLGGWEGVPTQYTPPAVPGIAPSQYYPAARTPHAAPVARHAPRCHRTRGTAHMALLRSTKEILGVNNAHVQVYRSGLAMLTLRPPLQSPLLGAWAGCEHEAWARVTCGTRLSIPRSYI